MDKRTDILLPFLFGGMIAFVIILWNIPAFRPNPPSHADSIIFAPHPDDSVLCCAGIIQKALSENKSVLVVNLTHGDDFVSAAALLYHKQINQLTPQDMVNFGRVRQTEDMKALHALGLAPNHSIFLGYPDGALDELSKADNEPYLHKRTLKYTTYGLRRQDYHTHQYGAPAFYMRQLVIDDIATLVTRMRPSDIYVTSAHDSALDHNAAYWLVYEALKQATYSGKVFTYVIHAPNWPNPKEATLNQPFIPVDVVHDEWQTIHLPWPPRIRVSLTREEATRKQKAISVYRSQLAPRDFPLFGFVKSEEMFW